MEHRSINHVEIWRVWSSCKPTQTRSATWTDRIAEDIISLRAAMMVTLEQLQRPTAQVWRNKYKSCKNLTFFKEAWICVVFVLDHTLWLGPGFSTLWPVLMLVPVSLDFIINYTSRVLLWGIIYYYYYFCAENLPKYVKGMRFSAWNSKAWH